MNKEFHDVEFETRTIGPLVLTTPVFRHLGFREIVNHYCPIAEQADIDHGFVAELVAQSRLSDPGALYDLEDWAERFAIPELYPEIERAEQLNDDRAGRMLDAIYEQRVPIWGELVANAACLYEVSCPFDNPFRKFCQTDKKSGFASSPRRHYGHDLRRPLR